MNESSIKSLFLLFAIFILCPIVYAQNASDIIQKTEDKMRGESSHARMAMVIVRPDYTREIEMESWASGTENAIILITQPVRDKGTVFLKRGKEIWNWQPRIERSIKLPPSMMMQSWMGSDFTNDDLVRESSIVKDYEHSLIGEEEWEGRACYRILMKPKPSAAVVWDRVETWVDKERFIQLKTEFYDEDEYLQHTIFAREVKEMDGRIIPSILEVVPTDKKGQATRIIYRFIEFDIPIEESFFSMKNMKRLAE